MTIYTKLQQAEHCERLARVLMDVGVMGYDHSMFIESSDCGTVCCAAGWACQMGIGGLKFDSYDLPYLPGFIGDYGSCDQVFGHDSYSHIFDCLRYECSDVLHHKETGDRGWSDSINLLLAQAAMLRDEYASQSDEGDRHRSTFIA